jgi:RsiW-degrading membrane proteinase PrsW (M82 family)
MTTVLLAAMAPSCIWLWYFYRRDKRPEPIGLVGLAFLLGVGVVYPTCLVQRVVLPHLPELTPNQDFDLLLVSTTILAGLVEEMAKFSIVLLVFAWRRDFDEPVDGLIYAAAVAMGFSAGEDYLRHIDGVEWSRLLNPPGHAMFAAIWGFGLGLHLIDGRWQPLALRLGLAVLVHGLWDALSIYREIEGRWWVAPMVFVLAFGLFWALEQKLQRLQDPAMAEAFRRSRNRWRQLTGSTKLPVPSPSESIHS